MVLEEQALRENLEVHLRVWRVLLCKGGSPSDGDRKRLRGYLPSRCGQARKES